MQHWLHHSQGKNCACVLCVCTVCALCVYCVYVCVYGLCTVCTCACTVCVCTVCICSVRVYTMVVLCTMLLQFLQTTSHHPVADVIPLCSVNDQHNQVCGGILLSCSDLSLHYVSVTHMYNVVLVSPRMRKVVIVVFVLVNSPITGGEREERVVEQAQFTGAQRTTYPLTA